MNFCIMCVPYFYVFDFYDLHPTTDLFQAPFNRMPDPGRRGAFAVAKFPAQRDIKNPAHLQPKAPHIPRPL